MTRPNLLFVFADQMRACDRQQGIVQTPNLDRLANEGAQFLNTFANCPVCTPSRATLLTGLMPARHRVITNDLPLPTEVPAIGDFLSKAGYRTGYIGKWHLDGVPRGKFTPPGPRRHGFSHWAAYNCSHDYAHPKYFRDTPDLIETEGYEPVVQTDLALEFIQAPGDAPFALFLSWGPPHDPYAVVPDEFRALYSAESIPLRPNVAPCDNPLAKPLDCKQTIANYYAAITALDGQFGRLLAALDDAGIADNTIVIFTSDHGDMLWSHGYMKKQWPYDEAIRVPFMIRWPGQIAAGARPNVLLSLCDLVPSLLGLLEITPDTAFDGIDLSPVMLGITDSGPEAVLLTEMAPADEALHQGIEAWRGLCTDRYTYARLWNGRPWLLFDNEIDPYQRTNLVNHAGPVELQNQLDKLLSAMLGRVGDESHRWDDTLREMGLTEPWNAREREMHGARGRYL